jgi:pyruvate/2-oxoglutarate dehydrogenase complex dihydrolipoamide dehydrogenase (E3) component
MNAQDHYQAIVIGSGQGGTPLAGACAAAGWRTALIERTHVGGTCVNEGCTPTKTMVASARVAHLARRGGDYGVSAGDIHIDMSRVRQRKRDIVDSFRNGSQKKLESTPNLDLIFGQASFAAAKTINVHGKDGSHRALSADQLFINAGARPSVPKLAGLADVSFLDSTSIMELDTVPEHLLVLGGGYIGLEFSQLFRRLGSKVTILQSAGQLMIREDPDIAEAIQGILQQDGIEILLNSKAEHAGNVGAQIELTVSGGNGSRTLRGSHLLVATGRTPNTETLNLTAAGIMTDEHGFIQVNENLQTNIPGIYALGDIKGGPAFTHISYDDFRILRTNLIEKGNATTRDRLVPYTMFIDPQLGRVGLTETQARSQGKKVRIAKMPMSYVARAIEVDETRGFIKAIVDAETEQILGAAVLGIEGGEIMALFEVAMMGHLPFTALREGIFAHPTLAESLNNLFSHFV